MILGENPSIGELEHIEVYSNISVFAADLGSIKCTALLPRKGYLRNEVVDLTLEILNQASHELTDVDAKIQMVGKVRYIIISYNSNWLSTHYVKAFQAG